MRIDRRFATALVVAFLIIAGTMAAPAMDQQPDRQLFRAFVQFNLAQLQNGQIYIGRPWVKPVGDWMDGEEIQGGIEAMTAEFFPYGPAAGDIILIDRRADDLVAAYDDFSLLIENGDVGEVEGLALWSKAISADTDCHIDYARDYLAVISVTSEVGARACIDDAAFWFRGVHQRYHGYAGLPASEATRSADERLAGTLRDCAPLGWLDDKGRDCVIRLLAPGPSPARASPGRR